MSLSVWIQSLKVFELKEELSALSAISQETYKKHVAKKNVLQAWLEDGLIKNSSYLPVNFVKYCDKNNIFLPQPAQSAVPSPSPSSSKASSKTPSGVIKNHRSPSPIVNRQTATNSHFLIPTEEKSFTPNSKIKRQPPSPSPTRGRQLSTPKGSSPVFNTIKEDSKYIQDLFQVFKQYDTSGDGHVDISELQSMLQQISLSKFLNLCVTFDDTRKLLEKYDINNDGTLTFNEFIVMVKSVENQINHGAAMHSDAEIVLRVAIAYQCTPLRSIMRPYVLIIKLLVFCFFMLGLCYGIYRFYNYDINDVVIIKENILYYYVNEPFVFGAIISTLTCVLISIYIIIKNYRIKKTSADQRYYITTIVLMLPIYSISSLSALLLAKDYHNNPWYDMLSASRECFEAVVLHDFLALLYSYCGVVTARPLPKSMDEREIHFGPPVDWVVHHLKLNETMVRLLEVFTLQYVLIRPLLVLFEFYTKGNKIASYFSVIVYIISTSLSLSALVCFYHSFSHDMKHHKPLVKFLSIKVVVFFSFYQALCLGGISSSWLSHLCFLRNNQDTHICKLEFENWLICVEMGFIFSLVFLYAFQIPSGIVAAKSAASKWKSAIHQD